MAILMWCLLLADNRVNPADENNHAIQLACQYGHIDVIHLLLMDHRIDVRQAVATCPEIVKMWSK